METPTLSPSTSIWNYDVFLSFRGEDTRLKFTDHLYHALCRAGINTFRDEEELRRGNEIRPALLSAIEGSRISIIVFSISYASSSWCLDELVKILECKNEKKQVVFPIFYEVDPSEVRHQSGWYRDAMVKHEKRYKENTQKVENWRFALREAANLSGESYKKDMSESQFIDKIILKISSILNHPLLHFPEQAVGLGSRKLQVVSLLNIRSNDPDMSMVGIYGIAGVGKTTIAKTVYNSIAAQFESTCFCADVRENVAKHGLAHIQHAILSDMLGKNDINIRNTHRGIQAIKERLGNKRVLLFLDDVDDILQLESLAGGCDWFCPGSRVIITTRDKQLLSSHGINKIYEATELNKEEALELLCWKAFRSNHPKSGFEDVSNRVASYAGGIPLALEIIGSHLFGKDVEKWESAMDAKKKTMDMKIFGILNVSYESLEYDKKEIFLDVACFFRGYRSDYVEKILEGCGYNSKYGLGILEDRCLLKRRHGLLYMHDLIQSMGREIVRRESEREPGERSRIWFHKDALQVLTRDMGTSKVQGLMLELPQREEVLWSGKAFKKMVNLKILIIHKVVFSKAPKELPNSLIVLEWENYPSSSLPSNFYGSELLVLRLTNAPQTMQLREPLMMFQNITCLNILDCEALKEVPDLSAVPNLIHLALGGCPNLVKIHDSVTLLEKLIFLTIVNCLEIKELPACNQFKSLKVLDISGCRRLKILAVAPKPLQLFIFYDAISFFQRGSGCGLIQELMDCHYSAVYCISGARIPRCFRYRSNTNSISFWVRKSFPDFHVSFAIENTGSMHADGLVISLRIGLLEINLKTGTLPQIRASTNIVRFARFLSDRHYLEIDGLLRSEDWVRVAIRVVAIFDAPPTSTNGSRISDAFVTECGVYMDRICDANFSFVDPTAVQNDALSSSDPDLLWKKIMCLNVPSHVKRFVWTTISDYLPSPTSLHVMKEWEWAKEVWLLSPLGLRVDRMEANDSCEWMLNMVSILDIESLELFMVIAWGLWEEWDMFCMGYETEDPTNLIHRMCVLLEDYKISQMPTRQDIYVQTDEETASDQPSEAGVVEGAAIDVQQGPFDEIDGERMKKNNIAACLEWLCFGK